MPDPGRTGRNQNTPTQADPESASFRFDVPSGPQAPPLNIALLSGKPSDDNAASTAPEENVPVSSMRVNWQLKTIWPVAVVLLAGLLLFLLSTVSLRDPERHRVLVIAGAGAVAICGVIIVALASTIQRPMIELQEQIERVGDGDLTAQVTFSERNDEIGDLGRRTLRHARRTGHRTGA
jgi:methyl-accepting chemotaxis protein